MIKSKVLRGLSVLVIVLSSFVAATAFAAPSAGGAASAPSAAACNLSAVPDASTLGRMTGTYLPGLSGDSCSLADVSASATTGADFLSTLGASCPAVDDAKLAGMTGTYLPGAYGTDCPKS